MNKATKVIIFLSTLIFACIGYSAPVYDQNFDDNNDWWSTTLTGDTVATYITNGIAGNTTHSGTGALSISSPDGNAENWYIHQNGSLTISITPEEEYDLTSWIKTENMNGNTSAKIRLAWRNAAKGWIGNSDYSTAITTDTDWTQISLTATAPSNAVGAQVYLFVDGDVASTATVTFDDIQIEATPEPPVFGQDFDENNDWWLQVVTGDAVATYITNGITGDTTYNGTGALSISSPDGGSDRWYMHKNGSFEIQADMLYQLSARIKTENMGDNTSTHIRFSWRDSASGWLGNASSDSISTDGDWTLLTLTAYSPTNAGRAEVFLMVDGDPASTATVTFDDIRVELISDPPKTYNTWLINYTLSGADALETADPDGDGYNNFMEYALGGDPEDPADSGHLPEAAITKAGSTNWFEVVHFERTDKDDRGLIYSLKHTDELVAASWGTNDFIQIGSAAYDDSFTVMTNRLMTDLDSRFVQLSIGEQ